MPTVIKLSGRMVNPYERDDDAEEIDDDIYTIKIDGYVRFFYEQVEVDKIDRAVLEYDKTRPMIALVMSNWVNGVYRDRTLILGELERIARKHPDFQ